MKIILDLCGGTGAWSRPYREAGYITHVITLPRQDVTKVHFNTYSLEFIRQDIPYHENLTVLYEDIYGILVAPPCTEFSLAKGNRPRDLAAGMETVAACLKIIWHCRLHGKLKFWALENPVGLLRQFLGKPVFTFEQWQFGDMGIKPTDLWGYFSPPRLVRRQMPQSLAIQYKDQHRHGRLMANPKCPEEYKHLNLDRAALRAITPSGFANAFFKANR